MRSEREIATTLGPVERVGLVGRRVASSLELSRVLGELTRGLVRDLEAAMARVWLLRSGELQLVASAGLSERLDGTRSRVKLGDLKIGEIAAKRIAVCTNDLTGDPRFADQTWIRNNALTTFAGYPLVFEDELLGVLALFSRRTLPDAELERLGELAASAAVAIKNASLFGEAQDHSARLEAENRYLKEELQQARPAGIVGRSAALARVLAELERVAPTSSTVLLRGETGTGKELFARALHETSPRRAQALVKVNCGAIAPTLIESELFGHEKGAFTGALQRRIGRFELAQGGTLFLDEIGELPLDAQATLLRALQEHEIERVGGNKPIHLDVRVVAATSRDLEALVRDSLFRADLFYRLNVFPIVIPPLRERREDIPLLAAAFLRTLAERHGAEPKVTGADALAYLEAYDWPGNVRELQNVLERATILGRGKEIAIADLPELANPPAADEGARATDAGAPDVPLKQRVDEYERALIVEALKRADGNQSEAARRLQTSRATLQYKMKIYGL